ncbi:AcrR family transcriptional regulator [Metabacillus crassostreae]|uniref:TetR/AcrR family transcriptional regulator n=1 Tax=Metabacillus crassostreae TaxID=929098 RepID=UPI00195C4324|nr:TetR/AcrR family transcriptional regulator [Metabacillus crassostreae]MBM7606189.1 AcrR family transcriptional regulator [Metabacillus crassostreae]
MNAKEKMIIEAGSRLFAKKGYSTTSIQEIVDACGMSKGAFYLHFKSKDALLLAAFKYQFNMIKSKIDSIDIEGVDPREAFINQLTIQFEEINRHKDFIIMQFREQTTPINTEVEDFIRKMGYEIGNLYHQSLTRLYGTSISAYMYDLNIILQGIIQSYLKLIIFEQSSIDVRKLSIYIMNRMDDLASGYKVSKEEPIITLDWITKHSEPLITSNKDALLQQLAKAIQETEDENLTITLEVIEDELKRDKPRLPVIQGMINNIPEKSQLRPLRNQIKDYFEL